MNYCTLLTVQGAMLVHLSLKTECCTKLQVNARQASIMTSLRLDILLEVVTGLIEHVSYQMYSQANMATWKT